MLKSFKQKLVSVDKNSFKQSALELFRYQAVHNPVYSLYLDLIGTDLDNINEIHKIPFMPISFFKHKKIKTGHWQEEEVFESSGTTGGPVSRHYIQDLKFYQQVTFSIFHSFYGNPEEYVLLALLPSYLEQKHSSLVRMVDFLIRRTGSVHSGFFLHNEEELIDRLDYLQRKSRKKIILFGITFALMDLAERFNRVFKDVIIMETGGMKGRREEIIRQEVHERLIESFHVGSIHSEYGMTELMSQAYSKGDGIYKNPPWMKVFTREITDPLSIDNELGYGALNVIDLANFHSCAFIATEDLGVIHGEDGFEILGRIDNSDTRGCNLMLN